MRASFFVPLLLSGLVACGPRTPQTNAPAENCPNGVVVTVSNPQPFNYDVYYQGERTGSSVIGEVSAGATVTFPLPGDGKGRVYVRRPSIDQTPIPYNPNRPMQEVRIRTHCAGT